MSSPSHRRLRASEVIFAIALVCFCTWLAGLGTAEPWLSLLRSLGVDQFERGELILSEAGGYHLLETLRLASTRVEGLLLWTALLLIGFRLLSLWPLALLVLSACSDQPQTIRGLLRLALGHGLLFVVLQIGTWVLALAWAGFVALAFSTVVSGAVAGPSSLAGEAMTGTVALEFALILVALFGLFAIFLAQDVTRVAASSLVINVALSARLLPRAALQATMTSLRKRALPILGTAILLSLLALPVYALLAVTLWMPKYPYLGVVWHQAAVVGLIGIRYFWFRWLARRVIPTPSLLAAVRQPGPTLVERLADSAEQAGPSSGQAASHGVGF